MLSLNLDRVFLKKYRVTSFAGQLDKLSEMRISLSPTLHTSIVACPRLSTEHCGLSVHRFSDTRGRLASSPACPLQVATNMNLVDDGRTFGHHTLATSRD